MAALGYVGCLLDPTPGPQHGDSENQSHHEHDEHVEHFVQALQLLVGTEGSQKDTDIVLGAAFYALGAQPAVVVPVHVARVLTPGASPTFLAAQQAAFFFVLVANLGVNGPNLGATCHGVCAEKTAHRAKVEAEGAAAEDER